MKVAIVVGHKPSSPGAGNKKYGLSEWNYNNALAKKISNELGELNVHCVIVQRKSYHDLPFEINDDVMPDLVVSLHCNAFNTEVSGTEVLYYHSSTKGKEVAAVMQRHLLAALHLPDRGIKPKHSEDRGGYLLRYTDAVCLICEPFFIDNDKDCERAFTLEKGLVWAYVDAIVEIAGGFDV